jgi:hypothetical protein
LKDLDIQYLQKIDDVQTKI